MHADESATTLRNDDGRTPASATPIGLIETSAGSWLAEIVPPIDGDRPFGQDIEWLV